MNTKRVTAIAILLTCMGSAGVLVMFRAPAEPTYKGKPISYWMMQTGSQNLQDNEGLLAIGTNALPYLAKALKTRPSKLEKLVDKTRPRLPRRVQPYFFPKAMTENGSYQVRAAAVRNIGAFGLEAASVLPEFHQALLDDNPSIVSTILDTLYNRIGPTKDSIPFLVAAWKKNTNAFAKSLVRSGILANLGKVGSFDPEAVVPLLIEALDDPDPSMRLNAPVILGRIGHPARPRRCRN